MRKNKKVLDELWEPSPGGLREFSRLERMRMRMAWAWRVTKEIIQWPGMTQNPTVMMEGAMIRTPMEKIKPVTRPLAGQSDVTESHGGPKPANTWVL